MRSTKIDLVGKNFGYLFVIGKTTRFFRNSNRTFWECSCRCGSKVLVLTSNLLKKTHNSVSCGCFRRSRLGISITKHGMRHTSEYLAWRNMRNRCNKPTDISYPNYGGRGIKVCERWITSFENFFADMGHKPSTKHSLDRIHNDRDYSPENCRWSTKKEQANNRRTNRIIIFEDRCYTAKQLAEKSGVPYQVFMDRLDKKGLNFATDGRKYNTHGSPTSIKF